MREVWKQILGYKDRYAVSNLGRVKSLERTCGHESGTYRARRTVPEKILKQTRWGKYLSVKLCRFGKIEKRKIHELILTTFVGPRPKGKQCCHDDGNHDNNVKSNLYWGTKLENEADKQRHGTTARGETNGNAKLTDEQVEQIRQSTKFQKDIAREFGISQVWVSYIKTGKCRVQKELLA